MFTAEQAIRFVYPIVTQYGASHSLGKQTYLSTLNMALSDIWLYKGYNRSWQLRKDNFTDLTDMPHRLITTHPMRRVHSFYCGEMMRRDGFKGNILCDDCDVPQGYCAPCTPCGCNGCREEDLYEVLPQVALCPGTFSITGSEIEGMGGLGGSILRVMPKSHAYQSLWVVYFREYEEVTSYEDIILMPKSFISIIAKMMSFYILRSYGQFRAGEENNMFVIAQQQLDFMRDADDRGPKSIDLSQLPTTNGSLIDSIHNFTYYTH